MAIIRFFRWNRLGQKNLLYREELKGWTVEQALTKALEMVKKTDEPTKATLFSVEIFADEKPGATT